MLKLIGEGQHMDQKTWILSCPLAVHCSVASDGEATEKHKWVRDRKVRVKERKSTHGA